MTSIVVFGAAGRAGRQIMAEAEKLLSPLEVPVRKAFTGDDLRRLASLLMNLGTARTGLGEFTTAEANLLEAQPIFVRSRHPTHAKDARECTQALVALYTSRNKAEPGKGYDAKAAEWKRKLLALAAPPSPQPAAH